MVEVRNRRWTPMNADRPGRPALRRQHCGGRSAGWTETTARSSPL
jgi:hypothetical protein